MGKRELKREVDAQIAADVAGIAASVHRFCNDVRLLAGMKQLEEPFEEEQVGSSAMAYKRNPMRCERATGLARLVISLASSPLQTAADESPRLRRHVARVTEHSLAADVEYVSSANVSPGRALPVTHILFGGDSMRFPDGGVVIGTEEVSNVPHIGTSTTPGLPVARA